VYWSSPEYQLADDSLTPDSRNPPERAGSAYDFYTPPLGVVHNANVWNSTRIVVNGSHVEHWANGVKLVEYDYWSPEFTDKYQKSKFKSYPDFARAKTGFIAIQGDHPGTLLLRNVKIRELK
jgi:hypothetical protein